MNRHDTGSEVGPLTSSHPFYLTNCKTGTAATHVAGVYAVLSEDEEGRKKGKAKTYNLK